MIERPTPFPPNPASYAKGRANFNQHQGKKCGLAAWGAIIALLLLSLSVNAQPIVHTSFAVVDVGYGQTMEYVSGGTTDSAYGVEIEVDWLDTPGIVEEVVTFCVELYVNIGYDDYDSSVVPLEDRLASQGDHDGLLESAYIMDQYLVDQQSPMDNLTTAATQAAIWYFLGDIDSVTASDPIYSEYSSVVAATENAFNTNQVDTDYLAQNYLILAHGAQDLLVPYYALSPTIKSHLVPVPAALSLLLIGLPGLAFRRKKSAN